MIKVGDTLPSATLMEYVEVEGNGCSIGPNPVDVTKASAGKTIALFALPGEVIALGLRFPVYAGYDTWMWLLGLYILVASVTPVWILLQPRDYLSSFLLYAMMILAIIGVIGCHPTLDMPAFTGFKDTIAPTGSSLGY